MIFKHCNSNIKIEWIYPSFWVYYRLIPTGNLRDYKCYWLNHFQRQWLHPNSLIGHSELLDMVPLSLSSLLFKRITLDYTKYALLFIMAVLFLRLFILSRILCFSFLPSSFSRMACLSSQAQCKSCFFSKTSTNLFWAIVTLHRPHTEFHMFCYLQSIIYNLQTYMFISLHSFWRVLLAFILYLIHRQGRQHLGLTPGQSGARRDGAGSTRPQLWGPSPSRVGAGRSGSPRPCPQSPVPSGAWGVEAGSVRLFRLLYGMREGPHFLLILATQLSIYCA